MDEFIHVILLLPIIFLNIYTYRTLIKQDEILSPYTFFYIMISIEFVGPLIYYLLLNGQSYKSFSEQSLILYYIIALFLFCISLIQIKSKPTIYLSRSRLCERGRKKTIFNIYIVVVMVVVILYLIRYRHQLLLLNVLQGHSDNLIRSDTSGLIPHWYTVSTFTSLIIPSFYFYILNKIRSEFARFILFFAVAFLTIIDGNKGVFIYLVLFMFLYVYKLRMNQYTILATGAAFYIYYLLKSGTGSNLDIIFKSAIRRFFVTQGACFINRIEMLLVGYDFSQAPRISADVYQYMYHTSGGSAPTVFWGDIYVQYGLVVLLIIIVISNWILYRLSCLIIKKYSNNLFLYWSYASVAYMLCMSELSFEHIFRYLAVLFNCLIFFVTVRKKSQIG